MMNIAYDGHPLKLALVHRDVSAVGVLLAA
jgi:hypothetical protein